MEIKRWKNVAGKSPVDKFIKKEKNAVNKRNIIKMLEALERNGTKLKTDPTKLEKYQEYDLWALKIRGIGVTFRIIFAEIEDTAWLLHIFKKKTDRGTSKMELQTAITRKKSLEKELGDSHHELG